MRRLPSRDEVTIRSSPRARTSAGASVEAMQTSAPRCCGIPWRRDYSAQLVHSRDQALVQRGHVDSSLGDPDLRDQLDSGDARVDRRDRRCAGLEAAGRRRRRVVVDVHLEDVPVREPAGLCREQPAGELAAAPEEPEPGGGEEVLQRAGAEEVDAERARRRSGRSRSPGRRRAGRALRASAPASRSPRPAAGRRSGSRRP